MHVFAYMGDCDSCDMSYNFNIILAGRILRGLHNAHVLWTLRDHTGSTGKQVLKQN